MKTDMMPEGHKHTNTWKSDPISIVNCLGPMWFLDFSLSQLFAMNAAAPKGAPRRP